MLRQLVISVIAGLGCSFWAPGPVPSIQGEPWLNI